MYFLGGRGYRGPNKTTMPSYVIDDAFLATVTSFAATVDDLIFYLLTKPAVISPNYP